MPPLYLGLRRMVCNATGRQNRIYTSYQTIVISSNYFYFFTFKIRNKPILKQLSNFHFIEQISQINTCWGPVWILRGFDKEQHAPKTTHFSGVVNQTRVGLFHFKNHFLLFISFTQFALLRKMLRVKQKFRCSFYLKGHKKTDTIECRIEKVNMVLVDCSWPLSQYESSI